MATVRHSSLLLVLLISHLFLSALRTFPYVSKLRSPIQSISLEALKPLPEREAQFWVFVFV